MRKYIFPVTWRDWTSMLLIVPALFFSLTVLHNSRYPEQLALVTASRLPVLLCRLKEPKPVRQLMPTAGFPSRLHQQLFLLLVQLVSQPRESRLMAGTV